MYSLRHYTRAGQNFMLGKNSVFSVLNKNGVTEYECMPRKLKVGNLSQTNCLCS